MKKIKIFQENNEPVILYDYDKSNLSEYCDEATKLLEVSNVTIIETTTGCFISRPHKITGILITEQEDNIFEADKIQIEVKSKGSISKMNNGIEIITDGESND